MFEMMEDVGRQMQSSSLIFGDIATKSPDSINAISPVSVSSPDHDRVINDTFYLMKKLPEPAEVTGETNLINHYTLERTYQKFSSKKVKEQLSTFLPYIPGNIDIAGTQDSSSLQQLVDKPPIRGKEIVPLNNSALASFKLHPGSIPDQYKLLHHQAPKKHKHKRCKREHKPLEPGQVFTQGEVQNDGNEPKKKKVKKHEDPERKKKKKEKKKKKSKHSPDHTGVGAVHEATGPGRP
ncbi:mediator of RNA polymerase II transcription subunit 19-like [Anneissia japonica]|uniref:mediator of RNA polymerase II transcription subunit 19-like n=1 Tax=Anneissia japonica TaxID=1529436 RepID=UPI00142583BE|nr:mediator of RNA polymerase II transcription subunit 19-like [Anneissia japonica]